RMHVDVVRGLGALRRLQDDWRRIYLADPEGQFFLSWPWMSKRLERRPGWFLLVARPTDKAPPVGLFPVRKRQSTDDRGRDCVELSMPGRGAADYTGFLCEPEFRDQVASAFARQLVELDWRTLRLQCLRASEPRTNAFLGEFSPARFEVERESMIMSSGIDNSI